MADQTPITRYVGDDWTVGPVTLTANGAPVDLTGAAVSGVFYVRDQLPPVALLTEGQVSEVGGITVDADRTTGILSEIWVSSAQTAEVKPQDRADQFYPTRLAVVVTDSRGRERTFALILYQALDRRADTPPIPTT